MIKEINLLEYKRKKENSTSLEQIINDFNKKEKNKFTENINNFHWIKEKISNKETIRSNDIRKVNHERKMFLHWLSSAISNYITSNYINIESYEETDHFCIELNLKYLNFEFCIKTLYYRNENIVEIKEKSKYVKNSLDLSLIEHNKRSLDYENNRINFIKSEINELMVAYNVSKNDLLEIVNIIHH